MQGDALEQRRTADVANSLLLAAKLQECAVGALQTRKAGLLTCAVSLHSHSRFASADNNTMAGKDQVLNLEKYMDQRIRVRFSGGREVNGILKGFDQLVNLVLDDCIEQLRDPEDPYRLTDQTRNLGLVVCRGPQVSLISPVFGTEEIENPFV